MFVTLHSDYGGPTVDSWNVVIVSRDCGSDILKEKAHCVIRAHKQTQQTELRVCTIWCEDLSTQFSQHKTRITTARVYTVFFTWVTLSQCFQLQLYTYA